MAVAAARAAPQIPRNNHPLSNDIGRPEVRLISRKQEQDPDGNYEYFYELDNGQKVGMTIGHAMTSQTCLERAHVS